MNAKHIGLLRRLEQFKLDSPDAAFPFSARLARENRWSIEYTRRVIEEYKRFAFLAVAAGHPVSPSEDVDQAWHLHLTYSENYWKVFCPEILGEPFHHQPTRGGSAEHEKFGDWYARTLQSYETFFGKEPPADLWPSPEVRSTERHDFARVDRERNWVIPKPRIRINRKAAVATGLIGVGVACSGAMLAEGGTVFDMRGPDFLGFYAILFSACFLLALGLRWLLRVPSAGMAASVPDLDGYSVAYLNGGKVLAVNTAVANLVNQNLLRVETGTGRLVQKGQEPPFEHQLERVMYRVADGRIKIGEARKYARPAISAIAEDLKDRGLVVPDGVSMRAIVIPLLLALFAVGVGIIKIFVGLDRGRPVGYLVALTIAFVAISLIALARRPLRSRLGDRVLNKLQSQHTSSRRLAGSTSTIPANEFALLVGMFGMSALAGTDLAGLRRDLRPPAATTANYSSSCGSSCGGASSCGGGGGGCGGGGGGCGGCGGGSS